MPAYSLYGNPAGRATYSGGLYDDRSLREGYRRSVSAGSAFLYDIQGWDKWEPSAGTYNGTLGIRQTQESRGLPLRFGIAVIDADGAKHVPAAYAGLAWDSAGMSTHINALLDYIATIVPVGQVAEIMLGNEVDTYFATHASEIAAFGTFVSNAKTHAKANWPSVIVTSTFKFSASASWATYSAIASVCDILSFTYYPIHADFTIKTNTEVSNDFSALVAAISNVPFQLQEFGCPSAASLNSSEALQSGMVDIGFFLFNAYAALLTSVMWTWQNDLTPAVLDALGLPAGNLRDYYGSLGMRTYAQIPKAGWEKLLGYLSATHADRRVLWRVPSQPIHETVLM